MGKLIRLLLISATLIVLTTGKLSANQSPSSVYINRLATAIFYAEGGAKTKHPYGILTTYKHTTPRQACINTIKHRLRLFNAQTKEKDSRKGSSLKVL